LHLHFHRRHQQCPFRQDVSTWATLVTSMLNCYVRIAFPVSNVFSCSAKKQKMTLVTVIEAADASIALLAMRRVFEDTDKSILNTRPSQSVRIFCRSLEQQNSQEFWKLFLPSMNCIYWNIGTAYCSLGWFWTSTETGRTIYKCVP
jgi:hypothetical protein